MSEEDRGIDLSEFVGQEQWERLIVPRVIQAMMRRSSIRIDDFNRLLVLVICKICALDIGDTEFDPDVDTVTFNMISKCIKRCNARLKPMFLKLEIDNETWVHTGGQGDENHVTLRSTITNLRDEPFIKVCETKGSTMKPLKANTPESKYLDAIITGLVNSRNGYLTENEIMDKAILDEVEVKLPAKFEKSLWVTQFRKYGFITIISDEDQRYTLTKRFRKENPKLLNRFLSEEYEDETVRKQVLAQLCMCEITDLDNLMATG